MTTQQPDARAGFYYVSVTREGGDYRLLRGPFVDNHAAALAAVPAARDQACALDRRGCWYAYGTLRSPTDLGPGILDKLGA